MQPVPVRIMHPPGEPHRSLQQRTRRTSTEDGGMNGDSQHVYPVPDQPEHDTNGLDCWCAPTYNLACDECEDGCWKCTDGLIPLTRAEAEATDQPLIIVHNR